MLPQTQIEAPKRQEQAKFQCSACGADRVCDCNAPAIEKLAAKQEQDRKRARAYRARSSRDATVDSTTEKRVGNEVDPEEAAEARKAENARLFDEEDEVTPKEKRENFLIVAFACYKDAAYSGPIDGEVVAQAKQTANAWIDLYQRLKGGLHA